MKSINSNGKEDDWLLWGFSICSPGHLSIASSYVCNLKILKNFYKLCKAFSRRKTPNDCCYRLTSSNVNTIKEMCNRWYRSQFNKFQKTWARAEILVSIFRELHQIKMKNWAKWKPLKFVRFFLTTISHTYTSIKPPWRAAINWHCSSKLID